MSAKHKFSCTNSEVIQFTAESTGVQSFLMGLKAVGFGVFNSVRKLLYNAQVISPKVYRFNLHYEA